MQKDAEEKLQKLQAETGMEESEKAKIAAQLQATDLHAEALKRAREEKAQRLEAMQQHLEALLTFVHDSSSAIKLGKTKVMVFNTTTQWVRRSAPTLLYESEAMDYADSYTYLGVMFSSPNLSLRKVAKAKLSRGYAP